MKKEILESFLGFKTIMHKTAFQMSLLLSFSIFFVNAQSDLEFYGASDSTNELIIYNTDTGNTSVVGPFGAGIIESMKFNSDFSILYALNGGQLGTVNVNNGHFTLLPNPIGNNLNGSLGTLNASDADAMAFDPNSGELYVAVRREANNNDLDLLIKVNPNTGQYVAGAFNGDDYVAIQTTGGKNDIDGMAINYTTGDLYAIANNGGVDDKLVIIDKATGAVTDLGIIRDANGSVNDIEALSILPDGRLFATSGSDKTIYKVNPTNGEVQSLIGTYASGEDFEGSVAYVLDNYYLHDIPSCNVGSNSGKIDWTTNNPFDLSEFTWTPDGALTNTLSDISGTGVNATITFSGETNTLGVWNGHQSPSVDADSNREALQYRTDGFVNGVSITIDFSVPINAIGFDLTHINASATEGDKYTVTGVDRLGNTIYPTFNEAPNPNYTTDAVGNINAIDLDGEISINDEVGVNFSSANKITSITLYWQNCDACGNGLHRSAIWDMDFCTDPVPVDPCAEIIPPGNPTSQVADADITWDFTGTGPAGDIILNGISITGEPNAFTNLIMPDNVIVSVQNLNISKKVELNGSTIADGTLGLAAFSSFVLAEAQDTNLNHYLKFDPGNGGTTQGDYVDYLYDEPIISARNRYVVATERGGNNSSSTQALDINGNPIGVKAMNIANGNYNPTGATQDNGQLIEATVYPLTALVSRGTLIYGIRYMQEDNGDGADGQAFIMRDPATIGCTITAENDDFSAIPILSGGTTPSVFTDNGNGVDSANGEPATNANIDDNISITNNGGIVGLTISPDGIMTIPSGTPVGTYTVEYQICLDIDNTKCDTAKVTLSVSKDSDGDNLSDNVDLDDDNDGILDVNEGCNSDTLIVDSTLSGTTIIGQSATITMPNTDNPTFELLSNVGGLNEAAYFDNANFTFLNGGTSLPDGLQIDFSSEELTALPNSGDGSPFNFDFGPASKVQEVYLHVNSVDQFRIIFKAANNPNITFEILSSVATNNLASGQDLSFGDDNVNDEDDSIADEQADGYGAGSSDGTIKFYSTNGSPITILRLGMLEQAGRPDEGELWQMAVEVRTCDDADNDGVPNYLDTDSDGDGCPDAIEAAGNFIITDLDIDNSLGDNVDANGVPNIANGGQATTGAVINNMDSSACLDSDGDNLSDNVDLDDDNDGILDTDEDCSLNSLQNASFETEIGWTLNNDADLKASQGGIAPFDHQVASVTNPLTITDNLIPVDGNYVAMGYAGADSFSQNITIDQPGDYTFCVSAQLLSGIYTADDNSTSSLVETMDFELRFADTTSSYTINATGTFQEFCVSKTINTAGTYNIRIYQPTAGNYLFAYDRAIVKIDSCDLDFDGDGIPNSLDLDSDNDGITDVIESGGTDANNDGIADGAVGNTTATMGIPSSAETGTIPVNTDETGVANFLDIDADDDGIPDNIEAQTTANWIAPSGVGLAMTDENNNGLDDVYENGGVLGISPNNFDGTDVADYIDTDSDNDGVLDASENGDAQNVASGVDTDGDGLDDVWDDVDDSAILGSTVNDNHNPPNAATLGDEDNDLANGGDVDYRDVPDLNPVLADDITTTNEDTPVIISIYDNDNNIPTTGTITTTNPANGTIVITDPNNTPNDPSDDVVTYTPNPNFNGTDTFDYTVCDNAVPPNCDTATVTVTVVPIVDLVDDVITTPEDTPVVVPVYDNDNDIPTEGTLTTTDPANGTVTIDDNGTPNDPSDDVVTYTPNQNYSGTDTFDYTICDNVVPQNCDTATVTVTILPVPDYSPTIFTGNTTIIGASGVVDFRVLVGEFANGNSNGVSAVELRIIKNAELTISFDNTLTSLNGQPVSNNQWQYDGSHPSLHKFIYIGNGGIFNAGTAQFIGINAIYTPPVGTNGAFPLKTTIKYFSGGEKNTNNNDDIDYIEYNNN